MKEEFLKEFRALLEKYNVGIAFTVGECSDTYGLYDEKMIVYRTVPGTFKDEDWMVVDGWAIDISDFKDNK
jgi:hypothetical protein